MEIEIREQAVTAGEPRELLEELATELRESYPEASGHSLDPRELAGFRGRFLVARHDARSIGCGAIRPLRPGVCELKSLYVRRSARRRGVGRRILAELERTAREAGYRSVRLETGTLQAAALVLYESAGYRRIAPFGEYADDPFSVCFEKSLRPEEPAC